MKFKPLPLAAGLVALSMGAASAAPATVVQDLHLRAGRSTGTPVIGILPGGTTVDASNCGGGWCAIDSAEGSGYASSRYLDIAGGYGGPVYGGPRLWRLGPRHRFRLRRWASRLAPPWWTPSLALSRTPQIKCCAVPDFPSGAGWLIRCYPNTRLKTASTCLKW